MCLGCYLQSCHTRRSPAAVCWLPVLGALKFLAVPRAAVCVVRRALLPGSMHRVQQGIVRARQLLSDALIVHPLK